MRAAGWELERRAIALPVQASLAPIGLAHGARSRGFPAVVVGLGCCVSCARTPV